MNTDLKSAKIQSLEVQCKEQHEKLYCIFARRNNFAAKPESQEAILAKVQSFVTNAELAALVDALDAMGRLDKVDYVKRCVDRLKSVVQYAERA
jgi:hypothetical protein